jgi:hypothetical protein
MKTARIKNRVIWSTSWLASAIAVIMAGCSSSGDAGARKAALIKANAAPQERPIEPRYYGGPKYPMYPQ